MADHIFGLTTMLNAAARCTSLTSSPAGRRQSEQVAGARDTVYGSDAIGRAEAHSADGYRLVDALNCRPAPGHFEVAQLTHQAGHQRALAARRTLAGCMKHKAAVRTNTTGRAKGIARHTPKMTSSHPGMTAIRLRTTLWTTIT